MKFDSVRRHDRISKSNRSVVHVAPTSVTVQKRSQKNKSYRPKKVTSIHSWIVKKVVDISVSRGRRWEQFWNTFRYSACGFRKWRTHHVNQVENKQRSKLIYDDLEIIVMKALEYVVDIRSSKFQWIGVLRFESNSLLWNDVSLGVGLLLRWDQTTGKVCHWFR